MVFGFWLAKVPVNARYKRAFKEEVVAKGLESVLSNMDFRAEEKLAEALVKESALFPHHDIYNGNDYLSAEYNGRISSSRTSICRRSGRKLTGTRTAN
jgi:hypothetical protein